MEEIFEKVCTDCLGDPQPLINFYRKASGRGGYESICKVCKGNRTKAWAAEHPKETLDRVNKWVANNRSQANANKKRWREKTKHGTSEHTRKLNRERRARQRLEAIAAMGGKCECCGLSEPVAFICFDHLGGWGNEHRQTVKPTQLPLWLKKHNYPKGDGTVCEACGEVHRGFRLLCYSCNMSVAKDIDGICAHKRTEQEDFSRLTKHQRYDRERLLRIRTEVLTAYGGACQCPGCDETNLAFLSIEHLGGWGGRHRLVVNHMLDWLKKHHYPKGNEICPECGEVHEAIAATCFNCNMSAGKSESGICPHEEEMREAIAA